VCVVACEGLHTAREAKEHLSRLRLLADEMVYGSRVRKIILDCTQSSRQEE